MFIIIFEKIRNQFQGLEKTEIKPNFKVIHSTTIKCFLLTLGFLFNFLFFSIFFKNIFLQILYSVFISLSTIEFNTNLIVEEENCFMHKRSKNYPLEKRIIDFYITAEEEPRFIRILNNLLENNPNYKNVCELTYKFKKNDVQIMHKMNIAQITVLVQRRKFLTEFKGYIYNT